MNPVDLVERIVSKHIPDEVEVDITPSPFIQGVRVKLYSKDEDLVAQVAEAIAKELGENYVLVSAPYKFDEEEYTIDIDIPSSLIEALFPN